MKTLAADRAVSAERALNTAIVNTDITRGYEEYLALMDQYYADDVEVLKAPNLTVRVDVFDRLPTPFGLVRGGVAPDHQKIKAVTATYEKVAADPRVRFFGNVTLGRDLSVEDLRARYDQIVYAVGCESDRPMGVSRRSLGRIIRGHRPGRLVQRAPRSPSPSI
jgi:NADPH-dependent glutamate synthase beta subunit-like oxidoreductase